MKPTILIGTSGWTYNDWQGLVYPQEIKKNKWLEYYATQFPTVELNATFYRWFNETVYQGWYDRVLEDFVYAVKIPRTISHRKNLLEAQEKVDYFYETSQVLKHKLAVYLLQLPPGFAYDVELLKQFIVNFPARKKLAIEFRNQQWYTQEVKDLLTQYKVITAVADSPKTKLINWLTADIAYIRIHGRTEWFNYCYKEQEIEEVADLVRDYQQQGAKKIFVYFNNTVKDYAIKNARYLEKILKL